MTYKLITADILDGLKQIEDNSIDLIVTSPPYNLSIGYDIWKDNLPWLEYYNWCEKWLKELLRVLKPDGRLCLNHYMSFGTSEFRTAPLMELNSIAIRLGYKHHTVAMWLDRTLAKRTAWGSWLSASAPYINSPYEGILILYKDKWKKLQKGKSNIDKDEFVSLTRGIWNIPTEPKGLTKANFPVALPDKCIKLLAYENSLILDPFSGAGTTGVAAIKNNCNYIGIELSPNYNKIAEDRLKKCLVQKN